MSCGAYPEPFTLMGAHVPDLRGLFLRGHGGNSAALGVQQGDAIRILRGSLERKPLECGELKPVGFLPHRAQVKIHTIPMAGELSFFNSMPPALCPRPMKTVLLIRLCAT